MATKPKKAPAPSKKISELPDGPADQNGLSPVVRPRDFERQRAGYAHRGQCVQTCKPELATFRGSSCLHLLFDGD